VAVVMGASPSPFLIFYVDGVQELGFGMTGLPATLARTSNFIGKSNWQADPFLKGSVYDLRVYDDSRGATEIRSDMSGNIDLNDPDLRLYYALNGNYASGLATPQADAQAQNSPAFVANTNTASGVTPSVLTLSSANVVNVNNDTPSTNQTLTFSKNSSLVGTTGNNTLSGTNSNDFLAGQGGNDILAGGSGADTFFWQQGETGSDTVTDFKVSEGDMINLSGLLKSAGLTRTTSVDMLTKYLQFTQDTLNANHAVLKIDIDGLGNFTTGAEKTIQFTNGWLNGLNDTYANLLAHKTIVLDQTSAAPLF
jgi:hypothetical protein